MNRPLIIGHRGASALAPENTIAAFRQAIAGGAEGLEFDVRLAGDGVPVVIHDRDLTRVGGDTRLVREVGSAQLVRTDVGSWFNKAFPALAKAEFEAETIPTLSQTLEFLRNYPGRIFIELKCDGDHAELSEAVADVIEGSGLLPQVIVKSFKLAVIPQIRRWCPAVRTAALFAPRVMSMLRKERYVVNIAEEFGADELSVHRSLATRNLLMMARRRSMPVTVWTADHPRWIAKAAELGLASIITNDPARLLKVREKQAAKTAAGTAGARKSL